MGLKQNLRRAEGQALNAAASAADSAKASGDSILFWNKVATRVFANAATTGEQPGPVLGARALSIVHLSMYDAYAGALGNPATLPKYLPQLEPAGLAAQASPKAAVAGAAYEALLHLYPKQKALLDAELLRFCDGAKGVLGLVGLQPSLVYGKREERERGGGFITFFNKTNNNKHSVSLAPPPPSDFRLKKKKTSGAYVANSLLLQRSSDPLTNIAVPYASYTPPAANPGYQYQVKSFFFQSGSFSLSFLFFRSRSRSLARRFAFPPSFALSLSLFLSRR